MERGVDARPDLEAVIDRYDSMLAEMRAEIAVVRPGAEWYQADGPGRGPVSADSNAEIAFSPTWAFTGSVAQPEAVRSEVLAALAEVGGRYGFSEPVVFVDRTNEIQVVAVDDLGGEYSLGSSVNTTLAYVTAPHPTRD